MLAIATIMAATTAIPTYVVYEVQKNQDACNRIPKRELGVIVDRKTVFMEKPAKDISNLDADADAKSGGCAVARTSDRVRAED